MTGTTRNADLFKPLGSLSIQGPGSAASPELLEVMSQDLGSDLAGFQGNFHYGAITVANGAYVQLVDRLGTRRAAPDPRHSMSTRLASLPARRWTSTGWRCIPASRRSTGTVINGTIKQVVSGGPIAFGKPIPARLPRPGRWTRGPSSAGPVGGDREVNPGNASAPAALIPYIENAQVSLIDPSNNVLATTSDANPGDLLTLLGVSLPVDGVYTIQVQAGTSQP